MYPYTILYFDASLPHLHSELSVKFVGFSVNFHVKFEVEEKVRLAEIFI